MIIQEINASQNDKILKLPSKQKNLFAKTQNNFRNTMREFNNIYSSPTARLDGKTKNPLITFNRQAKKTFFSYQQKETIVSRLSRRSKQEKEESKNIFRQTFSISKAYQTQKNKSIRPPTGMNQNYRPATRIRKISNIGEESNSNFLIKYQIIKQLGRGMYGTVHLARLKQKYIRNKEEKQIRRDHLRQPINLQSKSLIFQKNQAENRQMWQNPQIICQNDKQFETIQIPQIQVTTARKDQNNEENEIFVQKQMVKSFEKIEKEFEQNEQNLVAIKVYEKFKMNKDPAKFKNIRRQINIMQNLKHEGIIKLHQSVQSLTKISLVVQYGGEISLLDYLKKNYPLPQIKIKTFAKQILEVLIYLHQKNIVHRDIKLQNILVRRLKQSTQQLQQQIKIIDFGFSTLTNKDRKLNVICGTPNFMAPQLLSSKQYIGQKADIWSYGVVVYTLAEGRLPFKADNYKQLQVLANRGKINFKNNHSKNFTHFIKSVLKVKIQERPRAIDLLKFQWIQQ